MEILFVVYLFTNCIIALVKISYAQEPQDFGNQTTVPVLPDLWIFGPRKLILQSSVNIETIKEKVPQLLIENEGYGSLKICIWQHCYPFLETARTFTPKIDIEASYRDILQETVELLWSQQAHVLRIKIRESQLRRNTKRNVPEMQTIINELHTIIETELELQADRFWTPKRHREHKIPMTTDIFNRFIKNWNEFDNVAGKYAHQIEGIETECKEIREEIAEASKTLRSSYEDIVRRMKDFEELEEQFGKTQTKSTNTRTQKNRQTTETTVEPEEEEDIADIP